MSDKNEKNNSNGSIPKAQDFRPPKHLTPELKELRDATREAMQALREEIEKYGKKPDFRH